jgi:SAM-dependent methyltransferase
MSPTVKSQAVVSPPHEPKRLDTQASLSEGMTLGLLQRAGLKPAMRVLDVGAGTGAVSFLAAELVGSTGEVVGVDLSPEALALAEERRRKLALSNVRFVHADAATLSVDASFDAVIGRFILMHFQDPAALLSSLARHLRPGGIVAFQEPYYSGVRFSSDLPMCDQCLTWISTAVRRLGADPEMGLKLHQTFVSAGMPAPSLCMEANIGAGRGFPAHKVATELITMLMPAIEQLGIATRDEVGLDTLELRLRSEIAAADAVVILPPLIGAWTRV